MKHVLRTATCRLFVNKEKSSGPSTDPCGMPKQPAMVFDLWPSNDTFSMQMRQLVMKN